jgi:hypothetical protein
MMTTRIEVAHDGMLGYEFKLDGHVDLFLLCMMPKSS